MRPRSDERDRAGSPRWLIDEVNSAGRENLDAGHVQAYDQKMDARASEEIGLLASWGLDGYSVVVDFGCGRYLTADAGQAEGQA